MHPGFDDDAPYLFQTDHGRVLHCTCCHRFEVSFKQMQLRMERDAFAQLVDEIGQLPLERWEPGSFGVLRLTPPGAPSEVRLMLARHELRELCELVQGAAVMSELDDLIDGVLRPAE